MMSFRVCLLVALAPTLLSCSDLASDTKDQTAGILPITQDRGKLLDNAFPALLEKHGVVTAGVGVIKNGELVWTGYYGEHRPGLPASGQTQFNIASVTKTVTAETVLRLAADGRIDLDEPMAEYWLEDDIKSDPRAQEITPRMALTHSTGLPNWRFIDDQTGGGFDPDRPLSFRFDPGTSYGYSGEGFQYLARFVERKLQTDFEDLVIHEIYDPIGMENASLSRRDANLENIVWTFDTDGNFNGHYCRPGGFACAAQGEWSAAGNMRVTVPDYARFMISVMNNDGYAASYSQDRNRVHVEQWNRPNSIWIRCEDLDPEECPKKQGYGLGWKIANYGDYSLIGHDGSDHSEISLTYFYTDTKDGIIIFLNAPNQRASAMLPEAIELLHPGSAITPYYSR